MLKLRKYGGTVNLFKCLITLAAVVLCTAAAFAQNYPSPADQYGPHGGYQGGRQVTEGMIPRTVYRAPSIKINQKLEDKLKPMLPQNIPPQVAAYGFVDLKDFVATVRAANNLKIPFGELKHTMKDGSSKDLEKAIHKLKPDVVAKEEVKKAQDQAKEDIKESKRS